MGKVVEKVKLTSLFEPEKSVEVDAIIDTGATMVVLPRDIVEKLGLRKMREVKVRYANNKVETKPIYGVVNIELKGRSANLDVLVEEKSSQPLIGQVLLELLDLIVEPKTRKLIPNPASPEMPMMEILMETAYNSGYAVRSRSPKPSLRVSHTHNPLKRRFAYEIRRPKKDKKLPVVLSFTKTLLILIFLVISVKAMEIDKTFPTTFPKDKAGLIAYANIGENIDLEKAATVFDDLVEVNKSYVIGDVRIPTLSYRLCGRSEMYYEYTRVFLFIDKEGWIIAYFKKGVPKSNAVSWLGGRTILEKAIEKVCEVIGINYKKLNIKYYDFEFPEASNLIIIYGNKIHIFIPDSYNLYQASYYHYAYGCVPVSYGAISSHLFVDGKTISKISTYDSEVNTGKFNIFKDLTVGEAHTIDIWCGGGKTRESGVATVLIYKPSTEEIFLSNAESIIKIDLTPPIPIPTPSPSPTQVITPTPSPTPSPTPPPKPGIPGFEAIFAIAGLLVVYSIWEREKNFK